MSSTGEQTQRNTYWAGPGDFQPSDSRGAAKATEVEDAPGQDLALVRVILLANFLLVRLLVPGPEAPVTVPYTLFKEEAGKRNVEAIYSQGETITGRFKSAVTYPSAGEKSAAPTVRPKTRPARPGAPRPPKQVSISRRPALLRRPWFGNIFDR